MIRHLRRFAQPTVALLLTTGLLSSMAAVALAQYVPPDRGLPGRREGGGTRGGCALTQPTLTALIPSQNFGATVQEHPTFFWYVPQTNATTAEFVLLDGNQTVLRNPHHQLNPVCWIQTLSKNSHPQTRMPHLKQILSRDCHEFIKRS